MRPNSISYALYAVFFIVGLFFSNLIKKCSPENKVEIVIPEKVGVFKEPDTVYKYKKETKFVYKKDTIRLENEPNLILAEKYLEVTDSITRLRMYLEAIQERDEKYSFDNPDLKLEITTRTRGEILKIIPEYKIKEQKIEVAQKKTVLAMYLGGGVYNTVDMDNFGFKVDAGIQNKRGDIFTIGVDNKENIFLGVQTRILNIQK